MSFRAANIKKKGFTLLETLVVALILVILASIALPNYRRSVERAHATEVSTLLRAIYDSCERLAWENQTSTCMSVFPSQNVFRKLDITVKGTFSGTGSASVLETTNFQYSIGTGYVLATPVKADYKDNITIKFDGKSFTCPTDKADLCKKWGIALWNEQ